MENSKPRTIRVIVAGSRTLDNYLYFRDRILKYLSQYEHVNVEIITGMASNGPDDMAYHLARWDLQIPWIEMPADWDQHGRSAGYVRNAEMAAIATHLFVMWDGESKGTKHMIDIARQKGIPVMLHMCDPEPNQRIFIF